MFDKMLHNRLLKHGEQGQGVVTKRHDEGTESDSKGWHMLFALQGHIKFPDGTEAEFHSAFLNSGKVGDIHEGSLVPVRYDAADHSKAVLDVVALEAGHASALAASQAQVERDKADRIAAAEARAAEANARGGH